MGIRTQQGADLDEEQPRRAADITEQELEQMIRDVLKQTLRDDIAERALAWLDMRKDAYRQLYGKLH